MSQKRIKAHPETDFGIGVPPLNSPKEMSTLVVSMRGGLLEVDEPISPQTTVHHILSKNKKSPSHGFADYKATILMLARRSKRPVRDILRELDGGIQLNIQKTRELSYLDSKTCE